MAFCIYLIPVHLGLSDFSQPNAQSFPLTAPLLPENLPGSDLAEFQIATNCVVVRVYKWTILDANTLQKSGVDAISAESAANALQVLAEFPELAALVESWRSLPESERIRRLPSAGSIR